MNYKRSKYFTTSNRRKIKYLFINKNSRITVVFFHGFMSDMSGAKPKAIQRLCSKKKLDFLILVRITTLIHPIDLHQKLLSS